MKRLVITATGTEVGKTWVTAALCKQLRAHGHRVRALKPLATGASPRPENNLLVPGDSDAHVLLEALGEPATNAALNSINPITFADPLSPDMASVRAGTEVTADALTSLCEASEDEMLLIEGIGGAMVPLNANETTLDWFVQLGVPVVVVAGAYLGTLSHTLTTVSSLRGRGLDVVSVVVCERERGPVSLEETRRSLAHHLDAPVFAVPTATSFDSFPNLLDALPQAWFQN